MIGFILLVIGCDSNDTNSQVNVIASSELTNRENTILHTTSDGSFVFDYKTDDSYDGLKVWLDKYEAGELVDDQLMMITAELIESEGTIILTRSRADDDSVYPLFHIGIGDEGAVSSSHSSDESLKNGKSASMMSSQLPTEHTLDDEAVTLAIMAFKDEDSGSLSLSNGFYDDPEAHMEDVEDYHTIYLLKAQFLK